VELSQPESRLRPGRFADYSTMDRSRRNPARLDVSRRRTAVHPTEADPEGVIGTASANATGWRKSLQTPRWREVDSNLWYRSTKARDFRRIPGIAGGSSTGEVISSAGSRRRGPLRPVSLPLLSETG
jgi:hypothetical protein